MLLIRVDAGAHFLGDRLLDLVGGQLHADPLVAGPLALGVHAERAEDDSYRPMVSGFSSTHLVTTPEQSSK